MLVCGVEVTRLHSHAQINTADRWGVTALHVLAATPTPDDEIARVARDCAQVTRVCDCVRC
jgi:hypothetical protein